MRDCRGPTGSIGWSAIERNGKIKVEWRWSGYLSGRVLVEVGHSALVSAHQWWSYPAETLH